MSCCAGSSRPVGPRWPATITDAGKNGQGEDQNAHGELFLLNGPIMLS